MTAENITVGGNVTESSVGAYGFLEYSFDWTNFAVVQNETITLGDTFSNESFMLGTGSLCIILPTGYYVKNCLPSPDYASGNVLRWNTISGLGYGKPSSHLMEQPPRDPKAPVLSRGLLAWLATVGLVMGVVTLGVLSWAWGAHGETIARTMGLTTFLIAIVLLSFESRDQRRTVFNLDVLDDRTFLTSTAISIGVIFLGTTFWPFERLLGTAPLDLNQWLICINAGAAVVIACEVRKAILRRRFSEERANTDAISSERGTG